MENAYTGWKVNNIATISDEAFTLLFSKTYGRI